MAERYPVDFEALQKGDFIAPEVIEKWGGVPRHSIKYGFKLLAFKANVEKELRDLKRPMTLKSEKYGLRLLNDPDASRYRSDRQKHLLTNAVVQHRGLIEVDRGRLSDEESEVHDRRTMVSSLFVSAISGVRKEVRRLAHKRQTPGLPSE